MLANYHTHSTFSDGKNTPEEIVLLAIEQGFDCIGFSDHGNTPFDLRYCMTDLDGYIAEINRLKEKYAGKIDILLGIEEDIFTPVDREKFDYVISSSHYLFKDEEYLPFDSTYEYFSTALSHFDSPLAMAKQYFNTLCKYIENTKPKIIGHFDLITKYEEKEKSVFFNDEAYWELAENAIKKALQVDCIFEVNTGLITRGFRSSPCPHDRLLKIIFEKGGKVMLSSDSHQKETLTAYFDKAKEILKQVGFTKAYALTSSGLKSYDL